MMSHNVIQFFCIW